MINNIGIENFRVFKDFTEFEIAPITILTGPNNSGKSSLIKLLSLLKESFGAENGINDLLFDEGNHNLGRFNNVLNWDADKKHLTLVFDFPLNYFDEDFKIELSYVQYDRGDGGVLVSIKIFNDNRILCWVFASQKDSSFDILDADDSMYCYLVDLKYLKKQLRVKNEKDFLIFEYFTQIKNKTTVLNDKYELFFQAFENIYNNIIETFDPTNSDGNWDLMTDSFKGVLNHFDPLHYYFNQLFFKNDSKRKPVLDLFVDECNELLKLSKNDANGQVDHESLFKEFMENFESINFRIKKKYNEDLGKYLYENINRGINKLIYSLKGINHLTVNRGNQKRILANKSINAIDEIVKNYSYNPVEEKFLNESLKLLDINGKLEIVRSEGVISMVYLKNEKGKTLLSDLGFGYSQIIPIILKIILVGNSREEEWYEKNPYLYDDIPFREPTKNEIEKAKKQIEPLKNMKSAIFRDVNNLASWIARGNDAKLYDKLTKHSTLIIEEPEANLHPNLQSKFADILVLSKKYFNIKFIIETHSEYLIRKLQYLTAQKAIDTNDVNIYYYNSDKFVNEKEPKVKKIQIDEFGALTDSFGPGFYDEATNLRFELYKLNQGQKN